MFDFIFFTILFAGLASPVVLIFLFFKSMKYRRDHPETSHVADHKPMPHTAEDSGGNDTDYDDEDRDDEDDGVRDDSDSDNDFDVEYDDGDSGSCDYDNDDDDD